MTILFLCYANTCRSPMAESILRTVGGPGVRACSAGLHPTGRVASNSLAVLGDHGYETDCLASKGLDAIDLDAVDCVISLMGEPGLAALPWSMTAERVAWSIRDPFGEDEAAYDATVKVLEKKIRRFCRDRGIQPGAGGPQAQPKL